MMQRPTSAVDSIDHTLAALELLTQRETMRLSDRAKMPGRSGAASNRLAAVHDAIRQLLDAGMPDTCEAPQDIVLLATLLRLPQPDLDAAQSAATTARVAARPWPVAETTLARTAVLANRWTSPL